MRITTIAMTVLLAAGTVMAADKPATGQDKQPTIEVVFVLDTTGSMSNLIDGAKAKIWSIANTVLDGKPRPKVRMGLVAYRDKGDEYVTKVTDLTDNIDKVYEDLMSFRADGGGDGPENVNQALFDAINKVNWSTQKGMLRIIYLVGDYPPHNEYTDVPKYDELARLAVKKGLYINTILCGTNGDTRKVWEEIALKAEGKFMAIEQGGGVQVVATPFDKELAAKNDELMKTVVVYGDRKVQSEATARNSSIGLTLGGSSAAPSAAADRAEYASKSGKAGSGDLVEAVAKNKVDLSKVKKDELPENMKKMNAKEQKEYIQKQLAAREQINKDITKLSVQRGKYLREQEAKTPTTKPAGFDAKVVESLKEQGAKHNIKY